MVKKLTIFKKAGFALLLSSLSLIACNNDAGNNEASTDDTANTTAGGNTNNGSSSDTSGNHAVAVISATFKDTAVGGTALFDQTQDGKVQLRLELNIPSKAGKTVAVHIHEKGDCGDTAKSAGPHWNPTGTNHGEWESGSFHAGDIGNVELDAQGKGQKVITSELWTIGGDAKTNIMNRSVVVHGGTDDYKSQPAGNSGSRIGCGVIGEGGD